MAILNFYFSTIKCSAAKVTANSSFSIWNQRFTVSDLAREAYATGPLSWRSQAPRPVDEASACIVTFLLGPKKHRTGSLLRTCLILSTACWCSGNHWNSTSFFSNCLIGPIVVDMSGMKSLKEATVPISLRTSHGGAKPPPKWVI